jgi:hypothetical protein
MSATLTASIGRWTLVGVRRRILSGVSNGKDPMMHKYVTRSGKLIVAAFAASTVLLASIGTAEAKMVCYKDPGRGTVCTVVK